MKYIFWLTLIFIQAIVPVKADTGADSLYAVVTELSGEKRLAKLNELATRYYDVDKGRYARWLYEEAVEQRNDKYRGNALYFLARYYYAKKPDSMRYYITEAEPLYLSEKRYEELFRMKAWNLFSLSSEGKQDEVMPAVRKLIGMARELDYPEGEEMANQALANFYLNHDLPKEAVALYEEILAGMERRNAPVIKRFNILRNLLNASIPPEDHARFLERMKECLQECKDKGLTQLDPETSLDYAWYVYYRTLAADACTEGKKEQARLNLEKAEDLVARNTWPREKYTLDNIRIYYYKLVGRYAESLALVDSLIAYYKVSDRTNNILDMLELKGLIYYKCGLGMQSTEAYREYIALKDSIITNKYYNELADWRTRHDVDRLELKNKQMELQASNTHAQLLLMGGGLLLFVVISCALGFVAYSRHKYGIQLQKAKEKAEEADHLKSAFLANMNHEIRTPLNAIVGFSQILVDEEDQACRLEYYNIIQSNNELLQRLIGDVLDLSKIESNTMTLNYANVELLPLMNEIYSMTLLRMPPGVTLELKPNDNFIFYTDRMRLTQVITNLLNNAIKHTESGYIRFGYEFIEGKLRFSVEDTGEGIPESKLDSIFSRFVQLNDWSKGVGLGLAICKGLISKMGGTISVTSKFGEGSIFYIILPIESDAKTS